MIILQVGLSASLAARLTLYPAGYVGCDREPKWLTAPSSLDSEPWLRVSFFSPVLQGMGLPMRFLLTVNSLNATAIQSCTHENAVANCFP